MSILTSGGSAFHNISWRHTVTTPGTGLLLARDTGFRVSCWCRTVAENLEIFALKAKSLGYAARLQLLFCNYVMQRIILWRKTLELFTECLNNKA